MPTPFLNSNQKVELADGEHYVLMGKLLQREGVYYFRPDFNKQPWLASSRRMQWPYYPIDPTSPVAQDLAGRNVRFSGRAQGRVILGDNQTASYMIFLSPDSDGGLGPLSGNSLKR